MAKFVNHKLKLLSAVESLYLNEKASDVTLIVEEKKFPAHRTILSAQSTFFFKLFYEETNQPSPYTHCQIDAPLPAFEETLQYLYTGTIDLEGKCVESVLRILELSRRFALDALRDAIVEHLISIVTFDNLVAVIKAADAMNSEKLTRKCVECLNQKNGTFLMSDAIVELTESEVARIYAHPQLKVKNIKKFHGIEKWLKNHPECRTEVKERIIETIDISLLTNKELAKIVKPSGIISDGKILDVMVGRGMKDIAGESKYFGTGLGARRFLDHYKKTMSCSTPDMDVTGKSYKRTNFKGAT